jgi:hypothetical protein
MHELTCSRCQRRFQADAENAPKDPLCPLCAYQTPIQNADTVPWKMVEFEWNARMDEVKLGSFGGLALLDAAWLLLIVAVPWLQGSRVAACLTLFLLVLSFLAAAGTLMRRKRILVLLNLAQVGLFTALPFQLYTAFGQDHYEAARDPRWFDWLTYTLAHVLRAVDLLDVLASYQIDLQNLKPQSTTARTLLLWLRLAVDLFLFMAVAGMAGKIAGALRRRDPRLGPPKEMWLRTIRFLADSASSRFRERVRKARWSYLLLCLATCVVLALVQRWRGADWVLWPLDNVLRIADVPGAMDIYGWKLHRVEEGIGVSTLGVAFRLLCGLYLAEWLAYLSLSAFGGRGLRPVEGFIPDLGSDSETVRRLASEALAEIGTRAIPALVAALGSGEKNTTDGALLTLDRINDLDEGARAAAVRALGQVGPNAREAVPRLVICLIAPSRSPASPCRRCSG